MQISHRKIITIIFIAATPFIGSGCMMGMGGMHGGDHPGRSLESEAKPRPTLNQRLDRLIEQAVTDLATKTLSLQTLAIGELQAAAPIEAEILEGKLTAQLVEKGRLTIVDRQRLKLLLEEQGLSLSGAIDTTNAPKIGKMVGVDGFLIGTAVFNEDQLTLNLKIIATESGVIIWAKEVSE